MTKQCNLGLYIHIPFCTAKCAYCDFASFPASESLQREYVAALIDEIRQVSIDCANAVVDTIFIGGGTPSALYRVGLSAIYDALKKKFILAAYTTSDIICEKPHTMSDITSKIPNAMHINAQKPNIALEFTVEVNPESCNEEFIKECIKMGVNRLSLGLQTTSDALLKKLRRHTYNDFARAVSLARAYGITNINADLMLGLPGQTTTDVADSIEKLTAAKIPHISVYGLKVEEGTPLYKSGFAADDDRIAELYDLSYKMLCGDRKANALAANYIRYEVSNFCLPGHECRHNQKYWQLMPYVGLGLNASSCYGGRRTKNTADIKEYLNRRFGDYFEDADKNFVTEYIMLGLRTNHGIDLQILKEKGVDLLSNPKVSDYINKKILILSGNSLLIADKYFYIMNSIIADII